MVEAKIPFKVSLCIAPTHPNGQLLDQKSGEAGDSCIRLSQQFAGTIPTSNNINDNGEDTLRVNV